MKIQHTTQNLNSCKNAYCNSNSNGNKINSDSPSFKGQGFYNSKGLKKVLTSDTFGKLLDLSEKNPVILTSVYSLFLCTLLRPATIMALPGKNENDKKYAAAHSIASGLVGLAITAAILTPVGARVKLVFENPQKFLNVDALKRMHPNVLTEKITDKAGKVIEQAKLSPDGKLMQNKTYAEMREKEIAYLKKEGIFDKLSPLQKEGLENPLLCTTNEPIIYNGEPLRSHYLTKTSSDGKVEFCALQKNGTPVTEELKLAEKKNNNANKILTMIPDLLLAAPRAAVTVATIPFVLTKVLGMQKTSTKSTKPEESKPLSFSSNKNGESKIDYSTIFPGLRREVK